jgi:hypothetical protein
VADRIAVEIDGLLDEGAEPEQKGDPEADVCACMRPVEVGAVTVGDRQVEIPALAHVFSLCARKGIRSDDSAGSILLEQAKVFHYIPPDEEDEYAAALVRAYSAYLGG